MKPRSESEYDSSVSRLIDIARRIESQVTAGTNEDVISKSLADLNPEQLEELLLAEKAIAFLASARRNLEDCDQGTLGSGVDSLIVSNDSTNVVITEADKTTHYGDQQCLAKAIGRFSIERTIGQGGFARVFLAEDPKLQRKVALKVPLPHTLGDDSSRKRFEREAQAAAVLSHPAIVPIYESGSAGLVSYIAFGYCPGPNLAVWFADRERDVDARTAATIIATLAEAAEHAHQRGIVHRDLKPGNILIEEDCSLPKDDQMAGRSREISKRIRISDFGLARLDSSINDTLTLEGSVVGTPAYMSPEQARGESNVGPSSDIFSLGTMLYELLTGKLPHRKETHLATLRDIESSPACPPRKHKPAVPKDLESVCLKCLNKRPADRYQSAFELAADLNRWLAGVPVHARRASAIEKTVAWARRNPALAIATTVATLAVIAGLAGTTWQMRKANQSLAVSKAEYARAEKARIRAERIAQFLGQTYRSPNPTESGRDVKVLDLLSRAEKEIETEFAEDVELKWNLLHQIGKAYQGLGLLPESKQIFERLHAEHRDSNIGFSVDTVILRTSLAKSISAEGDFDQAEELLREAIAAATEMDGDQQSLIMRCKIDLASIQMNQGRYEDAIRGMREAIPVLENDPEFPKRNLYDSKIQLCTALRVTTPGSKNDEAIAILEEVIPALEELEGPDHPSTVSAKEEHSTMLAFVSDRLDEVADLKQEIYESRRRVLGDDHPLTLRAQSNWGSLLCSAGDFERGESVLQQTIEHATRLWGANNPGVIMPTFELANQYRDVGELSAAQEHYHTAYLGFLEIVGPGHQRTKNALHWTAGMHQLLNEWESASQLYAELISMEEGSFGKDSFEAQSAAMLKSVAGIHLGNVSEGFAFIQDYMGQMKSFDLPTATKKILRARTYSRAVQALLAQEEYRKASLLLADYRDAASILEPNANDRGLSCVFGAAIHLQSGQSSKAIALIDELLTFNLELKDKELYIKLWLRDTVEEIVGFAGDIPGIQDREAKLIAFVERLKIPKKLAVR